MTTSLQLARDLRIVVEVLRRAVRSTGTEGDVSRSSEAVLSQLRRKGELSTADLARLEQVRPQSMGATVGDLLAAGLIAARPDPGDGRRSLVSLTALGGETLERLGEQRDGEFAAMLQARLTDDERAVIAHAIELLERSVAR